MPPIAVIIESYLTIRTNANRARGTIALYRRQLADWQAWRQTQSLSDDLLSIASDELARYFAHLKQRPHTRKSDQTLSSASQSSAYRAVRAFWKWCVSTHGVIDHFAALTAPRVARSPRKQADSTLLRRLLHACDGDDEATLRMRAILLLLYESGARIGEVCGLTDSQVDTTKRRAWVNGKGGKSRPIFWGKVAGSALASYLLKRAGQRGGKRPFFRGTSLRNPGGPLTPDSVRSALKRLADYHGIVLPAGSPCHAFRHGFARRAITNGADISDVSKLLGHSSLATTMLYLEGDEDELAATFDRIFTPTTNHRRARGDTESHG